MAIKADNTIKDSNGKSMNVYENDMYSYADDYINSLPEKSQELIFTNGSNVFTGMIKYINKRMGFNNNKDIYNNITLLNYIWTIYTDLVYKYMQKPTLQEFALLIGCNRDTLYGWMDGSRRADEYDKKLGSSRADTVKKWADECRVGRYKGAQAGNVGCIFLCKAVDGMVETAPVQVINDKQIKDIKAIEQEYKAKAIESKENTTPRADF